MSYPVLRWVRARTGFDDQWCLCLGDVGRLSASAQSGPVERSTEAPSVHLAIGTAPQCARSITWMNHAQGFVANLVTSCLVLTASGSGLPVSTTHVSCGSLFGIGLMTGQANVGVIRQVVASWLLTLPLAALLAAVVSLVLG